MLRDSQVLEKNDSTKWIDAINNELKSNDQNEVGGLHLIAFKDIRRL